MVDLIHSIDGAQTDTDRAEMVFNGRIVVYRNVEAMALLVEHLKAIVTEGFAPHDPQTAERALEPDTFRRVSMQLRKKADEHIKTQDLFRAVFTAVGCDMPALYWDHLKLRFQPSNPDLHTRYMRDLPAHRDTWGSNIMAQINWWAPVWPVDENRTLVVFPDEWEKPVENDTATWSYQEFRRHVKADPKTSYPMLPTCRQEPDPARGVPIIVDPGDIVAFSGAHLHASVPNRTGLTRISTETRTVSLHDLSAGRCAPNLDGKADGVRYNWFSGVLSGESLSESGVSSSAGTSPASSGSSSI